MVARWEDVSFVPGPYADRELTALGDAFADAMQVIDERRARSTVEFATLIAEQAYARRNVERERDALAKALRDAKLRSGVGTWPQPTPSALSWAVTGR